MSLSRVCWIVVLLFLAVPWLRGDTAGDESVPAVSEEIQVAEQGVEDDVSAITVEGDDPADEVDEEPDSAADEGEEEDAADAEMRRYAELASRVVQLFENDDIEEVRDVLYEMVEMRPDSEVDWYNLSCAYARLDEPAMAMKYLERSIEEGWANFRHMERDPDLDPLRELSEYLEILSRREEIQRHRAEIILDDLVNDYGDDYLFGIDDDLRIVFATDIDERTLAEMKEALSFYASALQRDLFDHGFDKYLTVLVPREWNMGAVAGFYFGARELVAARDVGMTMLHEFTHALHFADQNARGQEHAFWTVEGLATLYESADIVGEELVPRANHRLHLLRHRLERNRHVSLERFFNLSPRDFMRRAAENYSQARYILFYLYDQGLLSDWYKNYVEHFDEDPSGAQAIEKVYGKSLAEFEEEWREWVLELSLPPSHIASGNASLGIVIGHERAGVRILQMLPGSGAEEAGLAPDDVITRIDEERIYDTETLIARISAREIGDTVAVEFRRGKEYLDTVVVLTPLQGRRASLPEPEPEPEPDPEPEHEGEQEIEEVPETDGRQNGEQSEAELEQELAPCE